MKTSEKLLNLLENGGDDAEFNARFWCWLNGYEFVGTVDRYYMYKGTDRNYRCGIDEYCLGQPIVPNYLTSLDACEEVMDEYLGDKGVVLTLSGAEHENYAAVELPSVNLFDTYNSTSLKHAWLHAMIQAIAHERGES